MSLAATTATMPRPSRRTLFIAPCSTFQPSTACLPPRFISAFAKQGPVQTSQVRASTYWPVMVLPGAGVSAGSNETSVSREYMKGTS